jgi:hypothetical protein
MAAPHTSSTNFISILTLAWQRARQTWRMLLVTGVGMVCAGDNLPARIGDDGLRGFAAFHAAGFAAKRGLVLRSITAVTI